MLKQNTSADDQMLATGRNVLELEGTAILSLSKQLDKTFVHAVTILKSVTGRIVVSGMGKSGHVARKIASTLASTGSPAQYVHPGEASHGDLGMIKPDDAIIVLSILARHVNYQICLNMARPNLYHLLPSPQVPRVPLHA